ncbi:MAG TPA: amino acid permease, partial [Coxiellaceae bacterium]|nr:amino acid permease [Coxiellaceae bacterium]
MSNQKKLGFFSLTSLVSGNMIGAGSYLMPAALAMFGTIGIAAWMLTAVGIIFLALIYARLSRRITKPGGPYAYCREAYGDFTGFQIAYNYWIFTWVGNAAIS